MASLHKVNSGIIYKYVLFRKNYLGFISRKIKYSGGFFLRDFLFKINKKKDGSAVFGKRPRLYCVYSGRYKSVVRPYFLTRMVFKYFAFNGLLNGVIKASW